MLYKQGKTVIFLDTDMLNYGTTEEHCTKQCPPTFLRGSSKKGTPFTPQEAFSRS